MLGHHLVAGLAVGSFYHRAGQSVEGGNNLLIDEIHDPKRVVPKRMAPSILITTTITHLFGGSAGREGTAVQMAGALADVTYGVRVLRAQRGACVDARAVVVAGFPVGLDRETLEAPVGHDLPAQPHAAAVLAETVIVGVVHAERHVLVGGREAAVLGVLQLHGGVGFTWEYDPHLYFKRARASEQLLGTPSWHRERLATLILETRP